ncbi:heparinase II/III family protein [Kutzneria sp. 744]|uniref:heparinase II/III domain-containing protein n=1 Tax=Kutzneria sp. (strain 744) TaxID=345341 RepID=UPI0004B6F988|nr:heparinase II/III family protein [Kutzneria sp. 744]
MKALTASDLATLLDHARSRIGIPDVTDRAVWNRVDPDVRRRLLAAAETELATPPPVLSATAWARAFRDGVRTEYEDAARRLRDRVGVAVLGVVLTGEVEPFLDVAIDGMVALAEASTWCWAPHDGFTAARGEVVPDVDDPYLDLGAAEVTSLLAWADHVLGPLLDARAPGLRRRLRREVDKRVFDPFERIRDWHWIGVDGDAHNWNPWIHGAVLTATLLLCDDPARRADLVRLVMTGLESFIAVLPDDGGIDEGVAYWWQGAGRLLEALDLLAMVGGPALDCRDRPVFAELIQFPHRMHLGDDWYVNAGDAFARLPAAQPWPVLYRWGERLGDKDVQAYALANGHTVHPTAGLGRALDALANPIPPSPQRTESWHAPHVWLPRVQVLVARETAAGLTLAMKAGHNGERHNHLDVGSYWVALHGRPVLVDVGQPTYTAASFGPDRYAAWPLQSAWHNVPEPGAAQQPGAEFTATGVHVELATETAALHADLAAAYPPGTVDSWRRTARLVRGPRPHVEVVDSWTGARNTVLLRHVLAGTVEPAEGGAVIELDDSRRVRMIWGVPADASLEQKEITDPLLRAGWGESLTRLTLRLPAGTGSLTVRWEATE